MKKKIFSILAAALVLTACAVCIYLYDNGLFKPSHKLTQPGENQIRVACVGDSVTYGMTMKHWGKNAYPFVLGEMLGDMFCTENFGFSGRTVMTSGDRPYVNEKLYSKTLEFEPQVVILQIGSNDSKSYNWKGVDGFVKDYETLLESYINLSSKPTVYICTPPPAFEKDGKVRYDIEKDVIADEIVPAVRKIAESYGIEIIDLYDMFDGRPELFNDGLHPNEEGASMIAQAVYEKLKVLYEF